MCIGIMNSSNKLLNLIGILAIGSFSFQVAIAIDDLDDTLKQALFLVKLLKTDFAQILRLNDDIANSTEEDTNSTCSLPPEDFNSTMAMNETEVTVSGASSKDVVSTITPPPALPAASPPASPSASPSASPAASPPASPSASPSVSPPPSPPASPPPSPPQSQSIVLPGTPLMMPYAPPVPMGYPSSIPGQRNFPDENYRFPYRHIRRRMMPDYYYYDSPFRSGGNFRRFNNGPAADLGQTSATSQAQTTSSLQSVTREASTLHVEETTASTTSLPTTKGQPSTSILRATNPANQSLLATADSTNQFILLTAKSILPKTKESNLPTIKPSTLKTKPLKRVRQKKRVSKAKAKTTAISKRNKKYLRVSHHHRRHDTNDMIEISQMASELEKELQHTEQPEDFSNKNEKHSSTSTTKHFSNENEEHNATSTTTKRKKTTTMKMFLMGSSRMPIPFPENNAFCYFNPESMLCG